MIRAHGTRAAFGAFVGVMALLGSSAMTQAQLIGYPVALDEVARPLATTKTGARNDVKVAPLNDGGYVAAWDGAGPGDDEGVFVRRFSADGKPRSTREQRVNVHTTGYQAVPVIAGLSDGGFVVVWLGFGSTGKYGVWARTFDAAGVPRSTTDLKIDSGSGRSPYAPAVTGLPNGRFVVVWEAAEVTGNDHNVYFRRYTNAGGAMDTRERIVNADLAEWQRYPTVTAISKNGSFVVAWTKSGWTKGLFARRFTTDGRPADATDRQINVETVDRDIAFPYAPDVTGLKSGGYVIAWQGAKIGATGSSIYFRRFDATGRALDTVERISSGFKSLPANSYSPRVVPLANGGFATTFLRNYQPLIGIRRHLASGAEQDVNPATVDGHWGYWRVPSLAAISGGTEVVVAFSYTYLPAVGASYEVDVIAQRFRLSGAPVARPDVATIQSSSRGPTTKYLTPLENDEDADTGDVLRLTSAKADYGQVVIEGNRLKYTVPAGAKRAAAIAYTIADRSGATSTARVSVTIAP